MYIPIFRPLPFWRTIPRPRPRSKPPTRTWSTISRDPTRISTIRSWKIWRLPSTTSSPLQPNLPPSSSSNSGKLELFSAQRIRLRNRSVGGNGEKYKTKFRQNRSLSRWAIRIRLNFTAYRNNSARNSRMRSRYEIGQMHIRGTYDRDL